MLFPLGIVVSTPGASEFLAEANVNPASLLDRHIKGDWGDLDAEDKSENDTSVRVGNRLLSSYNIGAGKVWIITERDRSSTTILLPEEY